MKIGKGVRIWFAEEKRPYRVRASSDRFAICTKPFNLVEGTVLYTIVDFDRGVRGLDDRIFDAHDYVSDRGCKNALRELQLGDLDVSCLHSMPVRITKIDNKRKDGIRDKAGVEA